MACIVGDVAEEVVCERIVDNQLPAPARFVLWVAVSRPNGKYQVGSQDSKSTASMFRKTSRRPRYGYRSTGGDFLPNGVVFQRRRLFDRELLVRKPWYLKWDVLPLRTILISVECDCVRKLRSG
jgi:hypothetical protein